MSVRRAQQEIDSREFVEWCAWLAEEAKPGSTRLGRTPSAGWLRDADSIAAKLAGLTGKGR